MAAVASLPARPLTRGLVLAVDVGGTKLAAGLVDREGRVVASTRAPTPAGAEEADLWRVVERLVHTMVAHAERGEPALDLEDTASGARAPLVACGVGCGGPMQPGGGLVSPLNIPGWREFPLRRRLEELTALPTFVDNDAKALALAEGWCGGATGRSDYLAMVVSTGVGGGIVLGGRLLDGRLGNAGHLGHVVVEPDGRPCRCGSRGCLEAEASGTAIEAVTGRPPAEAPPALVERAGMLVGRAVASAAVLLDLDLALVAGSVALGFGEPFFAAAQRELSARARISFARDARIVRGALGAVGPIVGAGAVGFRGLDAAAVAAAAPAADR